MQFFKNKLIYIIIALFILSIIIPISSYAIKETSYVWSEISSDIIETSSLLNENKRKFFRLKLW